MPSGEFNIFYDFATELIQKSKGLVGTYTDLNIQWQETGNIQDYMSATKDLISFIKQNPDHHWVKRYKKVAPKFELKADSLIAGNISSEELSALSGFNCIGPEAKINEIKNSHNSVIWKTSDETAEYIFDLYL
jgi:NDP-sugar pyrophosphorylase family protein